MLITELKWYTPEEKLPTDTELSYLIVTTEYDNAIAADFERGKFHTMLATYGMDRIRYWTKVPFFN